MRTGFRYEPGAQPQSNIAGPCVFWARYGAPGDGVQAWLQHGGYHFAWEPAALLTQSVAEPRQLFGMRPYSEVNDANGIACRAGEVASCVAAITSPNPDSLINSAFVPTGRLSWPQYRFGIREGVLLAHLEQEFGRERFAAFWQSDQPLEPAFLAAFGTPLGEWVMDWARRYYGPATRSARVSVLSAVLTLLTCAVLAAVAVAIGRRRQLL
jgi:hypothetical protein